MRENSKQLWPQVFSGLDWQGALGNITGVASTNREAGIDPLALGCFNEL